jgi:hypothetical protein
MVPAQNRGVSQRQRQDVPGMDSKYDIFEILPDGTPIWKGCVSGREEALQQLESLATTSSNELRIIHLPTKAVLAKKPPRARA